MKLNSKSIIYIYVAVLFALTFLFTRNLIQSFKLKDFNYFKLAINLVLMVYIVIKVMKLSKIENNKENNHFEQ